MNIQMLNRNLALARRACAACQPQREDTGKVDFYQPSVRLEGPSLRPTAPYAGYPRSYLDPNTSPSKDFYQYALGGYEARTEIPADRARYGIRTQVYERVQQQLVDILDEAAANPGASGTVEQKI
ncbi:MAG: hypothetical protein KC910_10030, partial [Candidatus Eremiobacteraeota bacterium]|nr:hypothetical protein [Candidatus Eremiobacteraeota bacterium]